MELPAELDLYDRMPPRRSRAALRRLLPLLAGTAALAVAERARAQVSHAAGHGGAERSDSAGAGGHGWGAVGVQGVAMVTRAAPALEGRTLTEGYLTQPVAMAHGRLAGGRVRLVGTLNLEGLTLRRGQLNAGAWGEGYVDRRHPHTLLHEALVTLGGALPGLAGLQGSITAGKGFVAFGTDDPMMRPFTLFPVNHHLAQLLERAVVIGALRLDRGAGSAVLEATAFNGDEPTGPWAWPRLSRFGDSWAARGTLRPRVPGAAPGALELSGSVARLTSPESPDGGGLDQRKSSLALRWGGARPERAGIPADVARTEYALLEWARTDEHRGARRAFRYQSVLAEAAVRRRGVELAARAERTARPEEERLFDPFRTVRPHFEQNVLGVTEWRILTVASSVHLPLRGPLARAAARAVPFVEVAHQTPRQLVRPSAFEPPLFYGARPLWTLSAGVRLAAGGSHGRMGRYGVERP